MPAKASLRPSVAPLPRQLSARQRFARWPRPQPKVNDCLRPPFHGSGRHHASLYRRDSARSHRVALATFAGMVTIRGRARTMATRAGGRGARGRHAATDASVRLRRLGHRRDFVAAPQVRGVVGARMRFSARADRGPDHGYACRHRGVHRDEHAHLCWHSRCSRAWASS